MRPRLFAMRVPAAEGGNTRTQVPIAGHTKPTLTARPGEGY